MLIKEIVHLFYMATNSVHPTQIVVKEKLHQKMNKTPQTVGINIWLFEFTKQYTIYGLVSEEGLSLG